MEAMKEVERIGFDTIEKNEKEMSKEKISLETELAMIEEEIKATKEAVKNDVQNFVPQYA